MTLQTALPDSLGVSPDTLKARLEVYQESVVLTTYEGQITGTRLVHPLDLAQAMMSHLNLSTSLLPPDTLWYALTRDGPLTALWRPPQVWKVALQLHVGQPAERLATPMPGLVFACRPGRAPMVWAARRRPIGLEDQVFHAPLFNVYQDGTTCAGTHNYPQDIAEAPESFFQAFFSHGGSTRGRSRRYASDLEGLWRELDGKKSYPLRDLMPWGKVQDLPGLKGVGVEKER